MLPRWYLGKVTFISCVYTGFLVLLAVVGMRFHQAFIDFKIETPPFTTAVIEICEMISIQFGWVLAVPIFLILPVVIARRFPTKRDRVSDVVLVLLIATTGLFVVAMFSPMVQQPLIVVSGPSK